MKVGHFDFQSSSEEMREYGNKVVVHFPYWSHTWDVNQYARFNITFLSKGGSSKMIYASWWSYVKQNTA